MRRGCAAAAPPTAGVAPTYAVGTARAARVAAAAAAHTSLALTAAARASAYNGSLVTNTVVELEEDTSEDMARSRTSVEGGHGRAFSHLGLSMD